MSVPLIHHLMDHSSLLFLSVSSYSNSIHHPSIHPPSIHPSTIHPSIHPPSLNEHLVFHFQCSAFYFCFTDYAKASDCVDHNKLWKILRDGNTRPPYLPPEKSACRSGSNRTAHSTKDWFQIGEGVLQGCILSPCLFNFYAEYIMRNAGLEETSWNQECWEKYQ